MAINLNYTLNASAAIADAVNWPTVRRLTLAFEYHENVTVLPPPSAGDSHHVMTHTTL